MKTLTPTEIFMYQKLLGYNVNDRDKLQLLKIKEQKIRTWERERDARFADAKALGIPLKDAFNAKRFNIFVKLHKKKQALALEKEKRWNSDVKS